MNRKDTPIFQSGIWENLRSLKAVRTEKAGKSNRSPDQGKDITRQLLLPVEI